MRPNIRIFPVIFCILLGACASPLYIDAEADYEPRAADLDVEQPQNYWWQLRFRLTWPQGESPEFSRHLLIAEQLLLPAIVDHQEQLQLWRFHRRARRDGAGHQFSLIFFADENTAVRINEEITSDPLRLAISGREGVTLSYDYRGHEVIAAYRYIWVTPDTGWGMVAKIDLEEVRRPFWKAGLVAVGFSILVVFTGAALLVRVSNPLILELKERSYQLEEMVDALSISEERLRTTYEIAGVGIAQVSLDGRFIDVNPRLCEITGYTVDEIKGLAFQEITHPDDLPTDLEYVRQLQAGEIDRYSMDKRYFRKDTSVIWVNLTVSLVRDDEGNPGHFIAVVEDMTARKKAETDVKRSLDEKEVLLREIHHRVKNNMQVISSLLSLQAANIDDARLSELFQESKSRVRAMALIHEILYDSGDLSSIDLKNYLTRLSTSLTRMFGADTGQVRLNVESDDINLGIDEMVPCGLAISELVSNCFKYAFPDRREGRIDIRAIAEPQGGIRLVVSDDGVGMPEGLDIRNTKTMGMGLVVNLVERQLRGKLELACDQGTRFTIVIPKSSEAAGLTAEGS